MKFRKKPVIIDAFRLGFGNIAGLKKWVESFNDDFNKHFDLIDQGPDGAALFIKKVPNISFELYKTSPGEWIIRDNIGIYFPCQANIFEKTYDSIDEAPSKEEEEEAVYTKEQLIEVADKAWEASADYSYHSKFGKVPIVKPDKKTYIKRLFKQSKVVTG